jgi:predicted NBD/HSP70 family sugar kinase
MKLSVSEIEILKWISYNEGISRKELSERTGLSPAGITKITKKLMNDVYIEEGEHISNGPGRKEIKLYSNPKKFTFLGLDIGGYRIRLALSDNHLNIVHTAEFLTSEFQEEPDKAKLLADKILLFLQEANLQADQLTAVGIGVTGIIDSSQETILNIPNSKNWDEVGIVQVLHETLKCPVYLDEGGRTMALAEKYLGKAKDQQDFIVVHIAFGVVAGILSNGHILRGINNVGGLLGHITADVNGIRCLCGNYGCLENIVTYIMLELAYKQKGGPNASLLQAYRQNDKIALDVCIEAGKALGVALSNVVNLFNPVSIYLGGPMFDDFPLLFEETKRTVLLRANRFATVTLKLERSTFNHQQGLYGALVMAKHKFIPLEA